MTKICRPVLSTRLIIAIGAVGVLLGVTGCASTGYGSRVPDSGYGVPDYVRNLPKSRTGNMDEYTVFGKRYRVMDSAANFSEEGVASWYGKKFHGRKTSSGEIYDMHTMTAAHKHLPLPTYVRVTNLENSQSVVVKVNDRGPFIGDRIIDMSYAAAKELGMDKQGVANVRVDALSTHLIAENDSSSNVNVAKTFSSKYARPNAIVPPVVEPQLTAVPLPAPLKTVKQIEPENVVLDGDRFVDIAAVVDVAAGVDAVVDTDTDIDADIRREDGFVELTPKNAAALAGNYYIQLGAFSQPPNANAMVTSVAKRTGLPAYVEKDTTLNLYRVKMGPFKPGIGLESALTKLSSVGIDGYTKLAANR